MNKIGRVIIYLLFLVFFMTLEGICIYAIVSSTKLIYIVFATIIACSCVDSLVDVAYDLFQCIKED